MKISIVPSLVNGCVKAPSSKSYMQRALVATMMSQSRSTLYYSSLCDDSKAVLEIIQDLGANVEVYPNKIIVSGGFQVPLHELNCHESGLALRMISPIVALFTEKVTINGSGSLLNRPIDIIVDAFSNLNIKISTSNNKLPITVDGNLQGGNYEVDGSKGSQIITGLLMALPLANKNSELSVKDLKSKPYISMTLDLLQTFGIEVVNDNFEKFIISGNQTYKSTEYAIEGDWSNAAFLLVAGAIVGEIEVLGLNLTSKQADIKILEVLKQVGADVICSENSIKVVKNRLSVFEFNAEDCPDLFPPLVALAAYCKTKSTIHGVSRLYAKESNRAVTLKEEFEKIGVKITIEDNTMVIHPSEIQFNTVNSHQDHRIAMALAIAGLGSKKGLEINGFECVDKSYPHFLEDLKSITQK
jgi:3-phosphoshikimate 1-carboxyvinyltransferase